jgi:flagellar L-ring protein precursor FlgH
MNNRIVSILVLTLFLLCTVGRLQAGSILAKRGGDMKKLYADDVARQIGDILTIKISEASKVDNKAKRDLKKETSRSNTFNGELGNNILPRMPGFTMSAESSNALKGQADYKDERSFIDCITVVVEDILPNGNLVVIGSCSRNIAGDRQIIEVSGIVRPSDIAFDNTVKSEQVANFSIVTKLGGISEPYNRPGWLGSVFDIIWPF